MKMHSKEYAYTEVKQKMLNLNSLTVEESRITIIQCHELEGKNL